MFSLGAWTVVLRLCLGEDTSTSTFGESLASWITLVGMVMVYVGYSFGMSQVIKIKAKLSFVSFGKIHCSIY